MRNLGLGLLVVFAACGDADSTANIGANDQFAAEEEVGSSGDALLSNAAQVWLPMQNGNTWTFTSASGATRTVAFSDVDGNIGWLDGVQSDGAWAGTSSSAPNTLYRWNYDLSTWEPLFRFGYQYTSWTIGAGCEKFTLKRTATDSSAVVPAGSFTGVRTIGLTLNPPVNARCATPWLSSISFAPGVGPVVLVSGSGEKFTLKSAVVNGKRYPETVNAVTSKLTFDQSAYTNKSNTIRCITTPCPGNAVNAVAKFTYVITNGTSETRSWSFSTGCQYDLTLSTSGGTQVKAVSEGRICTSSLTSITLAPGATKTIAGELELVDAAGNQLSGSLTAKAFLIPRQGTIALPVAPASAALSVSIVPAVP